MIPLIDLDTIVKNISGLGYPDLRALAESLADILDDAGEDNRPAKLNPDRIVPLLFEWSKNWEPTGS